MLPGRKGNLSSGSLSQDISKPQKSISGLFFGKESHAGASRAGGYSVLARPSSGLSTGTEKKILWRRLICDRKLEALVLYVNTCVRGCA